MKIVYKDFPLPSHPRAPKAAEAAHCAGDQGKYWEYHDVLFKNTGALDDQSLKRFAKDLGLDTAGFDACLDGGKHAERVRRDVRQGQELGVSGTPAFFINGRFLSGARPAAHFQEIIDDLLEQG